MSLNYEKHQRDYTLLASSEIMEEFFDKRMIDPFSYRPQKMYLFIKDKIFYHFIPSVVYKNWAEGWFKNNNLDETKKYFKKIEKILPHYKSFIKSAGGSIGDVKKINYYIRYVTPAIIISAYVSEFCNLNKDFFNYLINKRTIFEDKHRIGMDCQERILNNLEVKLKLKKDSLRNLTAEEFREFAKNNVLPDDLNNRNDMFLVEHNLGIIKIYNKREAESIINKIDHQKNNKFINKELSGKSAYKGIVSGRVRIIRFIKDTKKFRKGEILVTSMTDPRYLSTIKKASAFITDEGGVLCHAAIIAREMQNLVL